MGGVDKPLESLNGRPLVAHVREQLTQQVGRIVISANRSLDAYSSFGDVIVTDIETGLGPLGGLVSALALVESEWFFCCPGDGPRLDRGLVARLAKDVSPSVDALVPCDGTQRQYLFLLGRTSMRHAIADYLATGERSVLGFLDTIRIGRVDASDIAASFANINTPDELRELSSL
jgi:molybdopterin-guanine dinucleotide biosynthesis protein A